MFNELEGNTWSSLAKLRTCIGDVAADVDNALLESEMKRQRGNSDTGEVQRCLLSPGCDFFELFLHWSTHDGGLWSSYFFVFAKDKFLIRLFCTLRQVYILPTIRINDGQYRGKLSYTEVLRAICAGFTRNAEPKACMRVAVDDSCRDGSLGHSTCAARCAPAFSNLNLNFGDVDVRQEI